MEGTNEEFLGRKQQVLPEEVLPEETGQQQVLPEETEQMEFSEGIEEYPDEVDQFTDDYGYGDFGDADITGSEPKPLGGIYQLFDTVLNKPVSTKVSNLNKVELGELGISVRESMRIALLAKTFHHPIFAKFFMNQAGIISDSAMSKEGWFTELFVTSKRYATRESSSNVNALPQFNKGKWKMFSGKNKQK